MLGFLTGLYPVGFEGRIHYKVERRPSPLLALHVSWQRRENGGGVGRLCRLRRRRSGACHGRGGSPRLGGRRPRRSGGGRGRGGGGRLGGRRRAAPVAIRREPRWGRRWVTRRVAPAGPAAIRWWSRRKERHVTRRAAPAGPAAIRCWSRLRRWRVTRRASAAGAGGDPVVVAAGVKRCLAGTQYVRAAGAGPSYCITVATVAFRCHLDCI